MDTVASRKPMAVGSNSTTNVLKPLALTVEASGCVVTSKSEAFDPMSVTMGVPVKFKSALPEFVIVKVRVWEPVETSCEPKSV